MIGFDIGGTKCAVSVGHEQNGILVLDEKRTIPTDRTATAEEMIARMCGLAEELTADFSRIGISCGGPLDPVRGLIQSPPNLPGWDDVPIVAILKKRFPGACVALQNDANACAVAEWRYGAGKGTRNMIFLTFGTGMGAGLILNGKLYDGTTGDAGEAGHVRLAPSGPVGFGKAGSFEGFCSGGGIAETGKQLAKKAFAEGGTVSFCASPSELDGISAKTIADRADEGCADAIAVYETCGEKLGAALAVLVDLINPEKIVIGSIFRRSENLLRASMERVLKEEALPRSLTACEILPAALGETLGDYAALAVAASASDAEAGNDLYARYPALSVCRDRIEAAENALISCFRAGGKLLLCGNGGSAADCSHIVGELMKGFLKKRPLPADLRAKLASVTDPADAERLADHLQMALPAISLNECGALLSAFANDVDAENVFAQGVLGLGKPEDVLLCISTSGNSRNCVAAAKVARAKGLTVLSLTGARESRLSLLSDVCIRVPETETYRVQELHLPVYHALCADVEKTFFSI